MRHRKYSRLQNNIFSTVNSIKKLKNENKTPLGSGALWVTEVFVFKYLKCEKLKSKTKLPKKSQIGLFQPTYRN